MNASLDIVASPNTRLYIGRCLRDMGRTVEAYVELGRAAVEAKEHLKAWAMTRAEMAAFDGEEAFHAWVKKNRERTGAKPVAP